VASLAVTLPVVAVGQSSVTVSPFVSYVPSGTENPLAGMAITFGGTTGMAFRGSADISVENPSKTDAAGMPTSGYRPWSMDADALLFLGGLGGGYTVFSRSVNPYILAGIGLAGGDSAGVNVVNDGWSYGAGATVPIGQHADLFAEGRWRMPEYVLPTSNDAPSSHSEFRFGLSFHVGSDPRATTPSRRPRRRYEFEGDPSDDVASDTRASARPAASASASSASATINVNVPTATVVTAEPARRTIYSGAYVVVPTAESYIGVRYRRGGSSPYLGFDCSGFTRYVYRRHGVELPRTAREQAEVGIYLGRDWSVIEPGDLLLFGESDHDHDITHVAIYAGNNRLIHTTSSGRGVHYVDLDGPRGRWYREHFLFARRIALAAP
jgi:cell wall-associated NlpC family hydrolase